MNIIFNPSDIQGNILRGYKCRQVRHLLLEVSDCVTARAFLRVAAIGGADDIPAITTESTQRWSQQPGPKPRYCFNIGLTHAGLRALGVSRTSLATFPTEFLAGMAERAAKLGDFGESAPKNWAPPFNQPDRIHIVGSIFADDQSEIQRVQTQIERAFSVCGTLDGRTLPDNRVFFGYVDSISQPRFEGIHDADQIGETADPLGTALLSHPTRLENLMFRVPEPHVLGANGSFNAFRVLAQDCAGFEDFLTEAAERLQSHPDVQYLLPEDLGKAYPPGTDRKSALREMVAAQICGRWRLNGAPLASAPDGPLCPHPEPPGFLTDFDYPRASSCPAGAHIRRANPRNAPMVQRIAAHTRRLVRRGMVYGPDFDPTGSDTSERGLLGNFIGASIGAQFEAIMYDWINLGLHDPSITGSNDPMIGANVLDMSWFDLQCKGGYKIRLRQIPRFVTTRGGVYAFLPSMSAITYLATLAN